MHKSEYESVKVYSFLNNPITYADLFLLHD